MTETIEDKNGVNPVNPMRLGAADVAPKAPPRIYQREMLSAVVDPADHGVVASDQQQTIRFRSIAECARAFGRTDGFIKRVLATHGRYDAFTLRRATAADESIEFENVPDKENLPEATRFTPQSSTVSSPSSPLAKPTAPISVPAESEPAPAKSIEPKTDPPPKTQVAATDRDLPGEAIPARKERNMAIIMDGRKEFATLDEAAEEMGVTRGAVSFAIRHKGRCKGHTFVRIDKPGIMDKPVRTDQSPPPKHPILASTSTRPVGKKTKRNHSNQFVRHRRRHARRDRGH